MEQENLLKSSKKIIEEKQLFLGELSKNEELEKEIQEMESSYSGDENRDEIRNKKIALIKIKSNQNNKKAKIEKEIENLKNNYIQQLKDVIEQKRKLEAKQNNLKEIHTQLMSTIGKESNDEKSLNETELQLYRETLKSCSMQIEDLDKEISEKKKLLNAEKLIINCITFDNIEKFYSEMEKRKNNIQKSDELQKQPDMPDKKNDYFFESDGNKIIESTKYDMEIVEKEDGWHVHGDIKEHKNLEKELLKNKDEKLKIIYQGKTNSYIVGNTEKNIEAIKKLKSKKAKSKYLKENLSKDELNLIFGDDEKITNKILKKIDPQLLVILAKYNKEDKKAELAKQYVSELSKGSKADENNLDYEMTYNLKDMKKNARKNGLSRKDRALRDKLARKSEKIKLAKYIPDAKFNKKYLLLFATPLLGLVPKSSEAQHLEELNVQHKEIVEDINENSHNNNSSNVKKDDEKVFVTPLGATITQSNILNAVTKQIENNYISNNENVTIGDSFYLEGNEYWERSNRTGNRGKIGETFTRDAGVYTINGMNVVLQDGTIIKSDIIGNIENWGKTEKDVVAELIKSGKINEKDEYEIMYHISQGEGLNNCLATGWLSSSEIKSLAPTKTYNEKIIEQQKIKNNQNRQANEVEKRSDSREL